MPLLNLALGLVIGTATIVIYLKMLDFYSGEEICYDFDGLLSIQVVMNIPQALIRNFLILPSLLSASSN